MKRGQFATVKENKVKRRCSINGHYYKMEVRTPARLVLLRIHSPMFFSLLSQLVVVLQLTPIAEDQQSNSV